MRSRVKFSAITTSPPPIPRQNKAPCPPVPQQQSALYFVIFLVDGVTGQEIIGLFILGDGLVNDILRKVIVAVRIGLQIVTDKLFVEGRLAMACLVALKRPETAFLYSVAAASTCRGKYPFLMARLVTALSMSFCAVLRARLLLTNSSLLCSREKKITSCPPSAS